jgi:cytochrome bd-type quinol oxidase subunit 1
MRLTSFNDNPEAATMTRTSAQALAVARPVITTLIVINVLYGLIISGLLAWSFFIDGWPQRPLGFEMVNAHPWVGNGLRAIIVVGVVGAAIVHTILRRLLAIVDAVAGGAAVVRACRRVRARRADACRPRRHGLTWRSPFVSTTSCTSAA